MLNELYWWFIAATSVMIYEYSNWVITRQINMVNDLRNFRKEKIGDFPNYLFYIYTLIR